MFICQVFSSSNKELKISFRLLTDNELTKDDLNISINFKNTVFI